MGFVFCTVLSCLFVFVFTKTAKVFSFFFWWGTHNEHVGQEVAAYKYALAEGWKNINAQLFHSFLKETKAMPKTSSCIF